MAVVKAQSITRAWLLLKWQWSFYYHSWTCFGLYCDQCLGWGRPQEEERMALLLRSTCFCQKWICKKRKRKKSPHIPVLIVLQAASSCRLQCLGSCVPNLVEQGISTSLLMHANWKLLIGQALLSENFLSCIPKRRELFSLLQARAVSRRSFYT